MFEFDEVEGVIQALREMAMAVPWWFWAIPVSLLIVWVTSKPVKHAWRIRKASWVLRVLSEIGLSKGPRAQFGFLRSRAVDPYTFEEAILTALLERGVKIRRNSRYTGVSVSSAIILTYREYRYFMDIHSSSRIKGYLETLKIPYMHLSSRL